MFQIFRFDYSDADLRHCHIDFYTQTCTCILYIALFIL